MADTARLPTLQDALAPLSLACLLGLWGVAWNLPSRERALHALPPEADSSEFREVLAASWREMYARYGPDFFLSPGIYSYGFDRRAETLSGWRLPPPLLYNSARSFFIRSGHEDESNPLVAVSRIRPHRLEFNPKNYFYGGTYIYLLGAWLAGTSLWLPAVFRASVPEFLARPELAAWLYLSGRLFSAATYLLATALLWLVGRRLFGRRAGLLAALFFAASPGIVIQAHYMKPHLLGALALLGAYCICCRILESGGRRLWLFAGALVGLEVGAVYSHWPAAVLPAVAAWLRARGRAGAWREEAAGLAWAAAGAAAGFLLFNFFIPLEPSASLAGLSAVARFARGDPMRIAELVLEGLPKGLTLPVFLWVAAGVAGRDHKACPESLLAVVAFAAHLAAAAMYPEMNRIDSIRYFPAVSLGCLLAGRRAALWSSRASSPLMPRLSLAAALAAAAYAAVWSGVLDHNFRLSSTADSTHRRAGRWIEENLPPGSEIGMLRLPQPANSPYFQWNRYRLKFFEPAELARIASREEAPAHLVLASPTYDDRKVVGGILESCYEPLVSFEPYSILWLRPPEGEFHANPPIRVYKRRGS